MNLTSDAAESLLKDIVAKATGVSCQFIICPPFPYLSIAKDLIDGHPNIALGAQNCSNKTSGAFTGEVSCEMLKSSGVEYVIIGHSERRAYYNETHELIGEKLMRALENELIPIFCCGENLSERKAGSHFDVVSSQVKESIFDFLSKDQISKIIFAYEPVWAIGTGETASPDQAEEVHQHLRQCLIENIGDDGNQIPILYGGSCKPGNAKDLFQQKNIDGGLIGGASLKADDFVQIGRSF
ncbi:MAG: triose-phosphate isomerase [Flavobacteriales bacterium]|nr:triose-phosphate isomerase [Flavobacteriales bacterium]